jgi:hypothetical protein
VDMRRFTKLVGVEEEPVGSDDLDRWRHLLDSSIALGLTRCEMSGSLRTVACVHAHRTWAVRSMELFETPEAARTRQWVHLAARLRRRRRRERLRAKRTKAARVWLRLSEGSGDDFVEAIDRLVDELR